MRVAPIIFTLFLNRTSGIILLDGPVTMTCAFGLIDESKSSIVLFTRVKPVIITISEAGNIFVYSPAGT
jgi:hypothetical protein